MARSRKKTSTEKKYVDWCKRIAKTKSEAELIAHFRDHVYAHYNRHKDEGRLGLRIWSVGVFNFMNIFKEKYKKIDTDDLLFKLCSFYKDYKKGPKPSFDIDKFMKDYKSDMKDYYYKYQIRKKAPGNINK